jgi:SAM-dependent methyltransferase
MTGRSVYVGKVQDAVVEGIGKGSGAITKDGCPVEVYAALAPRHREAEAIERFLAPGGSALDLGSSPGLIAEPLAERGYRVVAVDNSPEMLAYLSRAVPVLGDIELVDLGERFDVVLLASHVVNTSDHEQRDRFLATAARHVKASGHLVVEWHPPEWFDRLTAGSVSQGSLDGFLVELRVHNLQDGVLSATVVYRSGTQNWIQTFDARRLAWGELEAAFKDAGLALDRKLTEDGRWVSARGAATP